MPKQKDYYKENRRLGATRDQAKKSAAVSKAVEDRHPSTQRGK